VVRLSLIDRMAAPFMGLLTGDCSRGTGEMAVAEIASKGRGEISAQFSK
jgi:hypothetical protein